MIEVHQVSKAFGSHSVLSQVELQINRGESLVIIGRSGCGKSVLLKHLIGLIQPDQGEVLVDGVDLSHLPERELLRVRRRFGMLFQSAALFDSMTVEQNIAFLLRRERQMTEAEIARRVDEALHLVDLAGTQHKWPAELSGGMRKRVGLARAIVYRPEILLYDEPTTGLDPIVADSIDRLMLRVWEELKTTSIVVTHDMRTVRRVGRRIVMLHRGRIHFSGTPEETFASDDPWLHRFVNGISDPADHAQEP